MEIEELLSNMGYKVAKLYNRGRLIYLHVVCPVRCIPDIRYNLEENGYDVCFLHILKNGEIQFVVVEDDGE